MHMLLTAKEQEWTLDIKDKLGLLWLFPICKLQLFEVKNLVREFITSSVNLLTMQEFSVVDFLHP